MVPNDKRSITVTNNVEQKWLARYSWPTQVTFDQGRKFIGQSFMNMIQEDYCIKGKPITTHNPQTNAIIERVHQVIGNISRTFELWKNYLGEDDPWKGILNPLLLQSGPHTTQYCKNCQANWFMADI